MPADELILFVERIFLMMMSGFTAWNVLQPSIDPKKMWKIITAVCFGLLALIWFGFAYVTGGSTFRFSAIALPPALIVGLFGMNFQMIRERELEHRARKALEENVL